MLEAGVGGEFVVDTGFSGSLYLPENKIADLNLLFITSARMVLANLVRDGAVNLIES